MKTKLGISVGLFGAAMYFFGILSSYMVLVLMAGYALLFEANPWLRRTAVKAIAIPLIFDLLVALLNLVPEAFNVIDRLCAIFKEDFSLTVIDNIIHFFTTVLQYAEKILLLIMGFCSVKQGVIRLPFIDDILDRHM